MQNFEMPSARKDTEGDSENVDLMYEAALDSGIDPSYLPARGSVAYQRLYQKALEYSGEAHRNAINRGHGDSETMQRSHHTDLCVMIYGKTWNELDRERGGHEKIQQIRNFAHLLGGRDQYVK